MSCSYLETNTYISNDNKFILHESRMFDKDIDELLDTHLEVIKLDGDNTCIYVDDQTMDDVWSFADWKLLT